MKSQPYKLVDKSYVPCEPKEATHLHFSTPGPFTYRMLPVMIGGTRKGTSNWTWNGDVESPTLKPSILTRLPTGADDVICHSFVNDGKIKFLPDCTHEYAGQTLDLLEVDI